MVDMDITSFINSYSVNRERIWLNNAGTTPIGDIPKKAVMEYLEEYSMLSIFSPGFSYPRIKSELLSMLAQLMQVKERNIALIHNTSEGMNFLSRGLSLKSGDTIYVLENEYPSNYYPWEHWQNVGVRIVRIPMQESSEDYLDSIKSTILESRKPECRTILSLSPVHWCSGIPLPMDSIGDFCKKENIWLAVDGAQGLGNVDVTPEKWGVKYLAASAWKWLLGPLGLGVAYVSDEALSELDPVFKGTQSVPDDLEYLPYKKDFKPTADRYEFSTPSFIDWVYWHASLKSIHSFGFPQARKRIHELTWYIKDGVEKLGINHSWGVGKNYKSGIISLDLNENFTKITSADWKKFLFERNVVVAERMNRIRVSPHLYVSEEKLDEFFEIVKELLNR